MVSMGRPAGVKSSGAPYLGGFLVRRGSGRVAAGQIAQLDFAGPAWDFCNRSILRHRPFVGRGGDCGFFSLAARCAASNTMRTITISTILGTVSNRLANTIVAGGKRTDLLRDLVDCFARGLAVASRQCAAAGYWLAHQWGYEPAGHSWQPAVCRMNMPTRSRRHESRRASGVAVKSGTVGVS